VRAHLDEHAAVLAWRRDVAAQHASAALTEEDEALERYVRNGELLDELFSEEAAPWSSLMDTCDAQAERERLLERAEELRLLSTAEPEWREGLAQAHRARSEAFACFFRACDDAESIEEASPAVECRRASVLTPRSAASCLRRAGA
jgi:hypothetical protein